MGLEYTGNCCDDPKCGGKLRDEAYDWDTDLPTEVFSRAREELRKADVCVVLGSSLRMFPAANMPLTVRRAGKARPYLGDLVIVNLQTTT